MRKREEIEEEIKREPVKMDGIFLIELLLDIRDQNARLIDLHETLASRLGLDLDPPVLMKHLKDILDSLVDMPTARQLQFFADNVDARLRTQFE